MPYPHTTTFYREHLRYSFFLLFPPRVHVTLTTWLLNYSVKNMTDRVTAALCQFSLPFLCPGSWRRESNSSSRKGVKPGRAGGAVLKIMEGTGSGLVSNSAAPSGTRGKNCGPLCPQGRNPLNSRLSAHGLFATHRRPKRSGQWRSAGQSRPGGSRQLWPTQGTNCSLPSAPLRGGLQVSCGCSAAGEPLKR